MTSTDSPDPSEKPEPIASVTALGSLDEAAYERKGQRSSRLWRKRNEKDTDSQESLPTTSPDKKPEPDLQPTSFLRLFRFATKWELSLNLVGLVAACAAGSAQPLMTLFFGNLVQSFVTYGTTLQNSQAGDATATAELPAAAAHFKHAAAQDASYIVYIGVGSFVCVYIYMYVWVYTAEVNAKRIRERYLQAILRQDIAYFDTVGAGEVATRIQTDTHLVQQGISEKVPLAVSFVAAFVAGIILAYVRSWRLALALSLTMIPCIGTTGAVMNKFVSRYKQLSLKHIAESGTVAEEVIATIRTAQAFGTQEILARLYDKPIELSRKADLKAAVWQGGGMSLFFFVVYSGYGLSFDYGTTLINRGQATAGQVINVFYSILIGSFSLALLAPELQAIMHARAAAAKLYETIDRVPPIDSSSEDGLQPDKCVGDITFDEVSFAYPSRPGIPILQDLSISFPAGRTAALVGASGSGKSTIVSLVERFYDPTGGLIRLDGVDIRHLNLRWLRTQIGLVSQEPTLFATTITGNVAQGLIGTQWEHAPDDEKMKLIKEACIKANADSFISKLPLGYDTLVGERGFLLSGGQKQRIAIARAIVSDPRILLLDEATSALDTQSEGIVQDALDKASAGRTTITIAHRLSTIKDAECIFVMGDGQILESGTHAELLQDTNGPYFRLVQAQKLRDADARQDDDDSNDYDDDQDAKKAEDPSAADPDLLLDRVQTKKSVAEEALEKQAAARGQEKSYALPYLFYRMGLINSDNRHRYIYGTISAILNGAVWPVFGIVFGKAIDGFSASDPHVRRHDGDRNALWLFVIAIISWLTQGGSNVSFGLTAAELTTKLRKLSFRAMLWQDIEFFDRDDNNTGALTSSLSDRPQKIEGLAGVTLGAIIQSIATLIVGLTIGIAFAWKLGLVALACTPFLVSVGYIRLRIVVLKDQKNRKAHSASAQVACEAAAAIRTVASLTRERDCCDIYSKSLEEPMRKSTRNAIWSNFLYAVSQSMVFFVIGLVFWYGSRLVAQQEYSTFHFFVALMSATFGSMQAGNVFQFVPDMSSATGAATEVLSLLDSKPTIDAEATDGVVPEDVTGRIRLEHVHFRYPTRPGVRVLRNFNLTVEPGTYVALVGSSGCGKSTIIQLIERFYDPQHGTIYLDDYNITDLNVSDYRKHIALVSQEPTLYAGSIRFNVLLGATKPASEVTQEELEEACRNANILEFIQSLPDGFDTEVGGKGSQLSGGQKQRIAIARALLRDPKVLLLDEATSALDSNSERVVQDALDRAAKGRTTIAIAHRLSTIQNADRIYFIKDGSVSESGTHDELLALKGGYYEYVQMQALSRK